MNPSMFQAHGLARPKAVRGVARPKGMNRIATLIPCHRIIGTKGNLTGYAGRLERKKCLIEFEKNHLETH